jgi:soluble lytic murein transglycosylase
MAQGAQAGQCREWRDKQELSLKITNINPYLTHQQALEIAVVIVDMAGKYGLDPRLVAAVVATESSFRAAAVSGTGDHGLVQVNARWWGEHLQEQGIINNQRCLYTLEQGIEAGCYVLAYYQRTRGINAALAAYNGNGVGYVDRVLKHFNQLRGE